jgi:signal transduction histidine kinase
VTITLELQADCLSLTISDNGRGLTPGAATGRGLTNMADRAAALGGSVSVRSDGPVGTTVIAELPLAPTVAS